MLKKIVFNYKFRIASTVKIMQTEVEWKKLKHYNKVYVIFYHFRVVGKAKKLE